ncbi:P-loop containing nucleoside triphosphate hydrolase protein [Apodospora peruviana]|uniref:P-loop containing nucleoside triphosphate hydrolase protein n=1 Tax=Apodospora peruviana TaxID=516989 RepID=A0AAE0M206_9PEZI|nr:P-loop containing nucleoside triphosphate hydrolase protein [Apodospora peruviana]
MKPSPHCLLQATRAVLSHENPLGLPKTGSIPRFQRGLPQKRKIKDVAKVIAVSSAKGGVGKSTVAANLSLAFARQGFRSGILDTDIFGPSIPTLFNLNEEPLLSANNQLVPLTNYGVKTMSIGYLVGEEAPLVWRGPMLLKAVQQLLHDVDWGGAGGLDILVLDLPPGTGDTQLSIAQQIVLDGSVIVTTPHTLAVKDAVKGINMFRKVDVPILGLVQNMSVFRCPHCHGATAVFGSSEGVRKVCEEHDMAFLGDVPLHPNIGEDGSRGKPTVVAEPASERAKVFMDIARAVGEKIGLVH